MPWGAWCCLLGERTCWLSRLAAHALQTWNGATAPLSTRLYCGVLVDAILRSCLRCSGCLLTSLLGGELYAQHLRNLAQSYAVWLCFAGLALAGLTWSPGWPRFAGLARPALTGQSSLAVAPNSPHGCIICSPHGPAHGRHSSAPKSSLGYFSWSPHRAPQRRQVWMCRAGNTAVSISTTHSGGALCAR